MTKQFWFKLSGRMTYEFLFGSLVVLYEFKLELRVFTYF